MRSLEEMNQLRWQSRRGMLELDLLLGPFLEEAFPHIEEADQERFIKLLKCEDQDIFGWVMEREEAQDPDLNRIVRIILDRVQPD
ncbi:FAD assembly factor SdhE [Endozoicomonadaceae bacterium StTr2]